MKTAHSFANRTIIPLLLLLLNFYRSCGQIFCADCSEYWAALPDERLFTPVRLCASCYQSVTIKYQVSLQIHPIDQCNCVSTGRIMWFTHIVHWIYMIIDQRTEKQWKKNIRTYRLELNKKEQ